MADILKVVHFTCPVTNENKSDFYQKYRANDWTNLYNVDKHAVVRDIVLANVPDIYYKYLSNVRCPAFVM